MIDGVKQIQCEMQPIFKVGVFFQLSRIAMVYLCCCLKKADARRILTECTNPNEHRLSYVTINEYVTMNDGHHLWSRTTIDFFDISDASQY